MSFIYVFERANQLFFFRFERNKHFFKSYLTTFATFCLLFSLIICRDVKLTFVFERMWYKYVAFFTNKWMTKSEINRSISVEFIKKKTLSGVFYGLSNEHWTGETVKLWWYYFSPRSDINKSTSKWKRSESFCLSTTASRVAMIIQSLDCFERLSDFYFFFPIFPVFSVQQCNNRFTSLVFQPLGKQSHFQSITFFIN